MISKIVATLVALVIILMLVAANELPQPAPPPLYVISPYEGRLLELERAAIDDAFRQKITQLWTVWMSDDKGQPARAVNGASQARKAYIASMQEIDKREANLRSK
jgi:hypothetical protein